MFILGKIAWGLYDVIHSPHVIESINFESIVWFMRLIFKYTA